MIGRPDRMVLVRGETQMSMTVGRASIAVPRAVAESVDEVAARRAPSGPVSVIAATVWDLHPTGAWIATRNGRYHGMVELRAGRGYFATVQGRNFGMHETLEAAQSVITGATR